jgi:hypothetical protein
VSSSVPDLWRLVHAVEDDAASSDEVDHAISDAVLHLTEALRSTRSEKVQEHIKTVLRLLDQAHRANARVYLRSRDLRTALRPLLEELFSNTKPTD